MRTDHPHTQPPRSEQDLRRALHDLAATARTPEAVQTRLAARQRRSAPRAVGFLVVAATLVVAAAVALPLILGRGGAAPVVTAAGGPAGVALKWTFSHSFDLPSDWRIRIRRITATSEVTLVATPAVGPMTRQCQFTVFRTDTRPVPSGPPVDIDGRPGTSSTTDAGATVHWVLADGRRASLTCADLESAALLARAVNDRPETITLPYRFTGFPDGYLPTSLALEYADDQTTTTVTLGRGVGGSELTVTASSLGVGESSEGEALTVNGHDAIDTGDGIAFNGNGQGITIRLDTRDRVTAQTRDRLLLGTAEALDIAGGSADADTALTP